MGYGKRKYISRRPSVVIRLRIKNSYLAAFFSNLFSGNISGINAKQALSFIVCVSLVLFVAVAVYTSANSAKNKAAVSDTSSTAQLSQQQESPATVTTSDPTDSLPEAVTDTNIITEDEVTTGENIYIVDTTIRGNTTGNTSNTGHAASSSDYIYFRGNHGGHIYRMKYDFTECEKVYAANARYINVLDGYVYFKNWDDGGALYRLHWSSSEAQKLTNEDSSFINVTEDWIYYRGGVDSETGDFGRLCRIKPDGTQRVVLNDAASFYITVYNDWIYYTNMDDGGRLYKIRTDGTGNEKLNDDNSVCINASGGYIYYCGSGVTSNSNIFNIFRIDPDGANRVKLVDEDCVYLNVTDNYIYYSVAPDKLSRTDLNGENKKVYPHAALDINIISGDDGDIIFHYDNSEHYAIIGDSEQRRLLY